MATLTAAQESTGGFTLNFDYVEAGAGLFKETGLDVEEGGEDKIAAAGRNFPWRHWTPGNSSSGWYGDRPSFKISGNVPALCRYSSGKGIRKYTASSFQALWRKK